MRFVARYVDAAKGSIEEKVIEADSTAQAAGIVEADGHALVELRKARTSLRHAFGRRLDLRSFCLELRAMLIAGMGVVGALEALVAAENDPDLRTKLANVLERVAQGKSLSAALESHPALFPPLFCAAIRSGEASGELSDSFGRYAVYLESATRLRQSALNAAIYPAVVCGFGLAVVGFLILYVVPRFAVAYESTSSTAAWPTRLLLGLATTLSGHFELIAAVALVILWWAARAASSPERRARFMGWLGSSSLLRGPVQVYFFGQLYRVLSVMLSGGYTALQALALGTSVAGTANGEQLHRATTLVEQGKTLTEALSSSGLTDPISLRLIAAGERSGRIAEMMGYVADHYERRLATMLEKAARLIEPSLMILVATLIGVIVVVMYMPIFDLATSLQ